MTVQIFGLFSNSLLSASILLCIPSGVLTDNELGSSSHPDTYVDKELILTPKEKIAFDKFKAAVYPNISDEWRDYLKQDLFLLRWIRAKHLNADVATRDMFQYLEFLRKNDMDKILDEDFSDLVPDFPAYLTHDRQGRPVMFAGVAVGWNVRRAVMQGKRTRLVRYTQKMGMQLVSKLIEINKRESNVTQIIALLNMEGFNVVQHSCVACIAIYLNLLETYEKTLPGYVREIIIINAPQAYLVLLQVLRTVASPATRDALHLFGTNKNQWKPYLDARIDPDNLPWEFGGKANGTLHSLV